MHFGKNYLNYTQVAMCIHAGIMFYLAATSLRKKNRFQWRHHLYVQSW